MLFDESFEMEPGLRAAWRKVSAALGITERIIGITNAHWWFLEVHCSGKGTRRREYERFDEILCGLLLVKEGLSGTQMRALLGLEDDLGQKAFQQMIGPLQGEMITGDDSWYALTDRGATYARNGGKFNYYESRFRILIDAQIPGAEDAHTHRELLGNSQRGMQPHFAVEDVLASSGLRGQLEVQRRFAEHQAREVHLPAKGFYLDHAEILSASTVAYPIRVAIIEDFRDHEVRFRALHAHQAEFLPIQSACLNRPELKAYTDVIVEQFLADNRSPSESLTKSEHQKAEEAWLAKVASTTPERSVDAPEPEQAQPEFARKSFDSLAFEDELDWLSRHCQGEVWLISPWIRKRAFTARAPQIRSLLERGCRVYVAASAPHQPGQPMLEPAARTLIDQLSIDYPHFYFAEIPVFHEKIVLAIDPEKFRYEYTGSFNVLSFYARNQAAISRENMRRLPWGPDSEEHHAYFRAEFAAHALELLLTFYKEIDPKAVLLSETQIEAAQKRYERLQRRAAHLCTAAGAIYTDRLGQVRADIEDRLAAAIDAFVGKAIERFANRLSEVKNWDTKTRDRFRKDLKTLGGRHHEQVPAAIRTDFESKISIAYMRSRLENLKTELTQSKGDIPRKERTRYEKKLAEISGAHTPFPEVLAPIKAAILDLIREKSQVKGLKVLGKIDVSEHQKRNKKKGK